MTDGSPDIQLRPEGSRRGRILGLAAVLVLVGAGGWAVWHARQASEPAAAEFVGAAACASCHASETTAWRGSQHAMAMREANDSTVLGNFEGATFEYAGVTSTFFRRAGKYIARTDGPDGVLRDFEVKYTFGVEPLQQYLIELPGGHVQPLSIAWDSRSEKEGGQRWFHLYPGQGIDHTDELHWTGRAQNWNFMCADCHSTNVRKGYDPAADAFTTSGPTSGDPARGSTSPSSPAAVTVRTIIPRLKEAGAQGIVEYPLNKIVL